MTLKLSSLPNLVDWKEYKYQSLSLEHLTTYLNLLSHILKHD